jgi:DNA-binding NtrC family response regulator
MERTDEAASESGILLVEDDVIARTSLSQLLSVKFRGIPFHCAEDGESGLALYRQHLPRVVITDIGLPLLNGIELARAIRVDRPQARIIVLSAHSDSRCLLATAELADIHFVFKPTDINELFAVVRRCFEEEEAG